MNLNVIGKVNIMAYGCDDTSFSDIRNGLVAQTSDFVVINELYEV